MKLGGEGRPVVGKLVPPEDYHGPIYFGQGLRSLSTSRPEEPRPENYDQMTRREQQAWHSKWRETPEAKAFYEAIWSDPNWRHYCFSIQEDGSFRIEDVIPGKYDLNIWLEERFTGQGRPEEIGGYKGTVEVPAMAEASTDEPLDLGELTLSMRHPLHVGDTVPAFEAETLDGKTIGLADYRGRHVLLSFWSPTFHPELNRLKELHAEYGKTGQLQIIGLGGTDTQDEVTSYISEHDIPWPQIYFGPDWNADLLKKLGGQMQIILIDPDGKIIATWLRGEDLTDTVRNALEEAERTDRVPLQIDYPEPGPAPYDSLGAVPRRTVLTDERPVVLVPRDVANVARGKPVTLSNPSYPILGEAEYVTDGDKRPMYFVEFEPESFRPHSGAYVTIDLEREYEIHAVAWWHDFHRPAVYLDIVVQVARDPQFKDAVTLYSNDRDDSLGLGIGDDLNYIETNKGWLAGADGVLGRYVRLWNRGNSRNLNAQYTEVEVYGRPPR